MVSSRFSWSALPSLTIPQAGRSMEHCGLRNPTLLRRSSSFHSSRLTHLNTFSLPRILQLMQLQNNIRIGFYACSSRSSLISTRNGVSSIKSRELCKIHWTIEADLGDSQLIFLTGDLVSLGCWNPDVAVLFSPSAEFPNLWTAEIEVPYGIHFKYNYFLKSKEETSYELIWRPGPEYLLLVPLQTVEAEAILVRDSWLRTRLGSWPILSWGSWMLDRELPSGAGRDINQVIRRTPGEQEMHSNSNVSLSNGEPLSIDQSSEKHIHLEKDATFTSSGLEKILPEKDLPVEEPWLLCSVLSAVNDLDAASEHDRILQFESHEKLCSMPEEVSLAFSEEPASTVILVNSSICTMQRIAVLEDGKLVELLLEPVKNNVQCDSIYLGVVKKLVPHMGGALADIGIGRSSLLHIIQDREPFVFPHFQNEIDRDFSSAVVSPENSLQMDLNANEQSDDEDDSVDTALEIEPQDESLQFSNEDFDDHEAVYEIDVADAPRTVYNGAFGTAGYEDSSKDYDEVNGNQLHDEIVKEHLPIAEVEVKDTDLEPQFLASDKIRHSKAAKNKWANVRQGTKIIVQVIKEDLGTKGPTLSAYPKLKSRFWILKTRCDRIGVSKKITGLERGRLKVIAKALQPPGFGLTLRTVSSGHSKEELQKDLEGLLATWKNIVDNAKSAVLAAEEGMEGAIPIMLHKAMDQTLSVVQDYFNDKVEFMVVDSLRTYHEVTSYLQGIAPDLCKRVRLHDKKEPIFDEYNIEEEIGNILSKRVPLSNGGSLVIEQTEALVAVDVNGGHTMLGRGTSQSKAILKVNLAAARQVARELRLRDIGGIIVVDFIDMSDESNKKLVYEEMKKAVERDRSVVRVSELSKNGLMEITRKRVRPSVNFMITEPCNCCHATGRVEALETSFSKIELEICRLLSSLDKKPDLNDAKSWPKFVLRVDQRLCNYLTSGKRSKLAILSSALKVWIILKIDRGFPRGAFEVKPFTGEKEKHELHGAISSLKRPETHLRSNTVTLFPIKKRSGSVK
ncbi:hypothetical protein HPP92_003032 [Vanilla planifolia]|uniref:CBM20 domain-containing protein n=1 Tax=Vanilla planifolia TaxID=51239 RepID=A0A835VJ14_VANPL|nr:hypothetical protein HPP92_003032 [Vanilla planifolia]